MVEEEVRTWLMPGGTRPSNKELKLTKPVLRDGASQLNSSVRQTVRRAMKPLMAALLRAVVVASAIVGGCRASASKSVQSLSSTPEFVSGWQVHDAVGLRRVVA